MASSTRSTRRTQRQTSPAAIRVRRWFSGAVAVLIWLLVVFFFIRASPGDLLFWSIEIGLVEMALMLTAFAVAGGSPLFRRRMANAVVQGCLVACAGTGLLVVLSLIFYSWATVLPAVVGLLVFPVLFALGATIGFLGRSITIKLNESC